MRRKMPRLTVRKLRQGIVYQQLFMNEGRMIYTPYSMWVTTYYSATVQADHRSPLFAAQRREFDFLWEQSADRRPKRPDVPRPAVLSVQPACPRSELDHVQALDP